MTGDRNFLTLKILAVNCHRYKKYLYSLKKKKLQYKIKNHLSVQIRGIEISVVPLVNGTLFHH